jgi:hypothetical protein
MQEELKGVGHHVRPSDSGTRERRLVLVAVALAAAGLAAWATVFVPHGERETGLSRSALVLALGCAALLALTGAVVAVRRPAPGRRRTALLT